MTHSVRPRVTDHRLPGPNGSETTVTGELLGFGSSQREYHNHPEPRDRETHPSSWKCSACRWFEVSIIYVPAEHTYAVHTVGRSAIPSELPRARTQFTESAYEIIEMLTDRRHSQPRLPVAAARCVAQAASVDSKIADAYVNRAVV